jgi:CubicO group peptidase (beta-lactamase class C family)
MPHTANLTQALQAPIAYAQAHEVNWPRDPHAAPERWGVHHSDRAPYNRLLGPVHGRGGVSGVIWQHGQELAVWGEPDRADLTFSVAKTFLALLVGVAVDQGLIADVHECVGQRLPGIGFDDTHNAQITWAQLLGQTSEWRGICLGMPDQVEHYRRVAHDPNPPTHAKGVLRPMQPPGCYWEYNDVRINQLSLALLHLFGRALPQVLSECIMQPLGISADLADGWRWRGYDDAWTTVGGQRVQSVPGGSHWGAGMSISARDLARVGQLLLDGGRYQGRQILSSGWVSSLSQPNTIAPFYGRLTWLNGDGKLLPAASRSSYCMVGAGGHYVWIDPELSSVVVVRWIDSEHMAEFARLVVQALQTNKPPLTAE